MRPSTNISGTPSRGTGWLSGALLLAGMAALVVLLRRVGAESVLRSIERVGPNFVWVLIAPVVGMVLHCCGWLVLLPKSLRPRPTMALAAYVE